MNKQTSASLKNHEDNPELVNTVSSTLTVGPHDVLCGRNKVAFNNIGNRRFRVIILITVQSFVSLATTRKQKSEIIYRIIASTKDCGGRFLNERNGVLVELSEKQAYDKVGHALRDMAMSREISDTSWLGGGDEVKAPSKKPSKKPREVSFSSVENKHSDRSITSNDVLKNCKEPALFIAEQIPSKLTESKRCNYNLIPENVNYSKQGTNSFSTMPVLSETNATDRSMRQIADNFGRAYSINNFSRVEYPLSHVSDTINTTPVNNGNVSDEKVPVEYINVNSYSMPTNNSIDESIRCWSRSESPNHFVDDDDSFTIDPSMFDNDIDF